MGMLDLFNNPDRCQNRSRCKPRFPPDQHTENHRLVSRKVVRYTFVNERTMCRYVVESDFRKKQAILAGLGAWNEVNKDRFIFARTTGRTPLRIRFTKLDDHAAHATQDTFPRGTINVDLSKHETADDLLDTVAHEFGYIVGYGHTGAVGDLMFALRAYRDGLRRTMRGRRGFRIPKPLNPDRFGPAILEAVIPVYGWRGNV